MFLNVNVKLVILGVFNIEEVKMVRVRVIRRLLDLLELLDK